MLAKGAMDFARNESKEMSPTTMQAALGSKSAQLRLIEMVVRVIRVVHH